MVGTEEWLKAVAVMLVEAAPAVERRRRAQKAEVEVEVEVVE
jgi:hypothetical protein